MPPDPPAELFHYTTASNFFNIFEKRQLYATSVQYMNDAAELEVARHTVAAMLKERAAHEPDAKLGLVSLADYIEHDTPHMLAVDRDLGSAVTVCAFSLSEEGDLLSQWRAYSAADAGYAIGFRTDMLLEVLKRPGNEHWRLARCGYTLEDHHDILSPLIEQAVPTARDGVIASKIFGPTFLHMRR